MAHQVRAKAPPKAIIRKPKRSTLLEAQRFDAEIRKHVGKWVALVGNRIVASGDTPTEAMENAGKAGHALPVIIRAPMSDEEVIQIL